MTSSRRPRLLLIAIAAVLGVALAGLVLLVAPGLLTGDGSGSAPDSVAAKVVSTAECTGSDPHDLISYSSGGENHTAKLNGCGSDVGEQLRVVLPGDGESFASKVSSAGDSGGARRVAFVLLALAGMAGGLLAGFRARYANPRARRALGV